ncbi:MAG: amidoligase family protein, partial [Pseudomonadota bacterium]
MSTIIADGPLPHPTGTDGGTRKVGVELEFGGVSAEQAAATVARVYDARAERVSAQQFDVRVEELGKFGVELDARWTHPEFVRGKIEDLPESWRDGLDVTIADLVAASGAGFDDNNGDFDMLLAAVSAAGLVDALADPEA